MNIVDAHEKSKARDFVREEVERAVSIMELMDMTKEQFISAEASIKSTLFDLESIDYNTGLQVYRGFLEKLDIHKDAMDVYEEFDQVYEASVNKKEIEKKKRGR